MPSFSNKIKMFSVNLLILSVFLMISTAASAQTPNDFAPPAISGGSTLTADQLPGGQCSTIGYPVDVKGLCTPGDALIQCTSGNRCQPATSKSDTICDTGYQPTANKCKTGDYLTTCPDKGNLCVTPLVAGGEKISQTLHEYKTKYTLPCQPLAGGQCASDQTPAGYIARLYQFGLMIVGLFAFGGIVYGALKYILSAGSMADQSDAKDQITQAVLGLALLLGSFLILYTINPEITNIRNPNLEVIQIKNIIKAGEADNSGEQKIPTGGSGSSDSLCKLAVNAQISLNVGADFSDSGNGTLFDLSGTQLPSGNQSGSKCISCKDNASLGSGGTCSCNSDYLSYNGECVLTSKCLSEIGTVGGPGGTECIAGQNCKLPGFTRNLALGGICTQTSDRAAGCPAGSTFVSSSAQPEIEPAFEKGYCQEQ